MPGFSAVRLSLAVSAVSGSSGLPFGLCSFLWLACVAYPWPLSVWLVLAVLKAFLGFLAVVPRLSGVGLLWLACLPEGLPRLFVVLLNFVILHKVISSP